MSCRAERGRPSALSVFAVAVLVAAAAALMLASVASADAISPESGPTPNAEKIDTLYKIVLALGAGVIALVWGVLFYSVFKFRAQRGRQAPQIRGNTTLELGWTAGAVGLVTVIATITLFFLDDIKNPVASGPAALAEVRGQQAAIDQPAPPGGDDLHIKVGGQQYLWRFQYPNGAISFHDMIVPRDTTVTLEITSNDVAHSWWIPQLGGKMDAIRGYVNESWFKASETGTYEGQCAEFCGTNHAYMSAKVIVVEPEQYKSWVDNQKKLVQQAQQQAVKQRQRLESETQ